MVRSVSATSGQHHARLSSTLFDATLVGVVDSDLARTHAIAPQYGTSAYPYAAALLRKVDAAREGGRP